MKKANTIYLSAGLLCILAIGFGISCKKFVDTPLPVNSLTTQAVFRNDSDVVAAVRGAYYDIAGVEGTATTFATLFSDEITFLNAFGSALTAQTNTYDATTDYGIFNPYYKTIYDANSILEALASPGTLNNAVVQQVKGEAYFLRAYSHYKLVNFFGSVPLITTADVTKSALAGNTTITTTYTQLVADLNMAYTLLSDAYPSGYKARVNKQAAAALLARVYLYQKDYINAEAWSTKVIASGLYSPLPDPNNVFLSDSKETIWQLWNAGGYTDVGVNFIPDPTSTVYYQVNPSLINAFEPGDKRLTAWVQAGTGASSTIYYPYKYKQRDAASGSSAEYLVELRLGEQYLIRAEARANQNNPGGSIADLNVIRSRAGLPNASSNNQADLLLKIEQERRIEMAFEDESRWFDLNRTNRTSYWLTPIKPTFTAKAMLLPFPQAVINTNPNLKQNPGYN